MSCAAMVAHLTQPIYHIQCSCALGLHWHSSSTLNLTATLSPADVMYPIIITTTTIKCLADWGPSVGLFLNSCPLCFSKNRFHTTQERSAPYGIMRYSRVDEVMICVYVLSSGAGWAWLGCSVCARRGVSASVILPSAF